MVVNAGLSMVNPGTLGTTSLKVSFIDQWYQLETLFFLRTVMKQQQVTASIPVCSNWQVCHLLFFNCSILVPTFQTFPGLANYRPYLQQPSSPSLFSICSQSFLYPSLYGLGGCYARLKCHVPTSDLCSAAHICHLQPSAPPASWPTWGLLLLCLCSAHIPPSEWECSS